jgi:UDPglucose--hexose-1-phosphate uridylyltransferase
MASKEKIISELRQDIISGDWVVIATGRAKRPHEFLKQKRPLFSQPRKTCPFENLHEEALLFYAFGGRQEKNNWWVEVIPNKYPAFGKGACSLFHQVGPYHWTEGVGFHEVVITRSHERSIAEMSREEVELILRVYQERYLAIKKDECVRYISILHNHGRLSGATIFHPHSQIIAIPVIPPDIGKSIRGSKDYSSRHKACIHCLVLRYELKAKERIIYENESFMAVTPFASKTAFEIRIFPKKHSPHFEEMRVEERGYLADVLQVSLAKLFKGLKNPDYNFFLHTAPTRDSREFDQYHWHFEILPKTSIWGGFEISTGIEISTITPEEAAKFLRETLLS